MSLEQPRWNGYNPTNTQAAFDASQASTPQQMGTPSLALSIQDEEIARLEEELSKVEEQIAEFDRQNPGFASGMVDIAAKRAEAGDMSLYNTMVSTELGQRQMGAAGRDAAEATVWENINSARNARWALREADESTRRQAMDAIETSLDNAERAARKAGIELPKEYYALRSEIGEGGDEMDSPSRRSSDDTVLANTQRIERLVREKRLTDNDISELYRKARELGDNSTEGRKLIELANKYRYRTVEAGNRYKKRKNDAKITAESFKKNGGTPREKIAAWEDLKMKQPKNPLFEFFNITEFGDIIEKEK